MRSTLSRAAAPQVSMAVWMRRALHAGRARSNHTTIETCGAAARESVLRIGGLADLILYDLKILDPARHRQYTGGPNRNILENLEALVAASRPVTVRIPVVPGVNDGAADVRAACDYLAPLGLTRVDLLPYHRTGAELSLIHISEPT